MSDLRPYPQSPSPVTNERWRENRKRYNMQTGCWSEHLRAKIAEIAPNKAQRQQWGPGDTTRCLFASTIVQLAILYDYAPVIQHEDTEAAMVMEEYAKDAGLWQLSKINQRHVLGQREGAIRVWATPKGLRYRLIPAHLLEAHGSPDEPDQPALIYEYRVREWRDPDGAPRVDWTRDCWDVRNPMAPVFRVESEDGDSDLTALVLGHEALAGDAYPYWHEDEPQIPIVLYHAQRTGKITDPFTGSELVNGSLTIAAALTFWSHVMFDASHPQRYAVNANLVGLEGSSGEPFVVTDPSSLLLLESAPGRSPVMGQWQPGGDPAALGEAIRSYATDMFTDFDISPADVSRTHSTRSGYAIEITRSGQRDAQRRYEPEARRGDTKLLQLSAIVANTELGTSLPVDGWDLHYRGLPLTNEEKKQRLEEFRMRSELGLASPVQLLAELDGITEGAARLKLREIRRDRDEFSQQPNQLQQTQSTVEDREQEIE